VPPAPEIAVAWFTAALVALVVILVAISGFAWVAGKAFDSQIDEMRSRLTESQGLPRPARTDHLPSIVEEYALKAGGRVDGPPLFHARHMATLATGKDRLPMSIRAEQWTGTRAPGLVWKADGSMMGLPVTVVDSYVEGKGTLEARVLGTFRVAGGTGPDFDRGELMRYLSELPVYPDAILNATGLVWRQIDDRTVEVTGQSMQGPGAVRFLFDEGGDIVGLQADDRPMTVGNNAVPTPWRGTYSRYAQFGAYRIPSYSEAAWVLADGLFTYWKGEVTEYAPQ
jgi:hypothetical protein